MNSSKVSPRKRNAILQNKLNVRSPVSSARSTCPNPPFHNAPSQNSLQGRGPYQTAPALSNYGSGSIHSLQATRPPAGVPSHLARRTSASPSTSSYQTPFKQTMNKSPRYRKPPVTNQQQNAEMSKATRAVNSCDSFDQQKRDINTGTEEERNCQAESRYEAGGDFVDEYQQQPDKEPEGPNFAERYMKLMQEKLLIERPNEFRPSSAVGDVKSDIARLVVAADVEQHEDPNRPHGHVTLLAETCQATLQALRTRYETLQQEYNTLPVESDTLRTRHRRGLLERELTQIEEGLHVFSRSKVHVRDLDRTHNQA